MKKLVLLALASIMVWSCNNPDKTPAEQHTTVQEPHQHDENVLAIETNNGGKWLVNEEMKPYVNKGEELVDTYLQSNQTDYKALAKQLKIENDQLVKSCTMKGKDHDELHKWLRPHLTIVDELEKQTDPTKANETVAQLQDSYQLYHQYFN